MSEALEFGIDFIPEPPPKECFHTYYATLDPAPRYGWMYEVCERCEAEPRCTIDTTHAYEKGGSGQALTLRRAINKARGYVEKQWEAYLEIVDARNLPR